MNVFFEDIDQKKIKYIGFDMDGTLYDEYDFIIQVYTEISELFQNSIEVLRYMSIKWLNKGSSYNRIFEETYDQFKLKKNTSKKKFVEEVLNIYREFQPKLNLSNRAKFILEILKKNFNLFLITDGNPILQKKKFASLDLQNYFDNDKIVFTGDYPPSYHKPNIKSIDLIKIECERAIFFGDRDIDKKFASSAKMNFKYLNNMLITK